MQTRAARRGAMLFSILLATTPLAHAAHGQERQFPAGTLTLQRDPNDPSALLNKYLRTLSSDPRNLDALVGAGRAALAMGDANAAIGFFGRGEAVSPRNGRVKAGLAAAAVQQEQPKQALTLFDAAIAAGVPVADIGADRGLAYDLRGQNRLAQADYRAALAVKKDDETVRRLALSLAIGGDQAAAMTVLDPLLRRQDKAAWRAATFVMAMTGDAPGAIRRANQLMMPTQAAAMTPYLQRLGALNAAEKAAAVHFGRFPAVPARGRTQVASAIPAAGAQAVGRALTPSGTALGPASAAALNRQVAAATTPPVPTPAAAAEPVVVRMVTAAPGTAVASSAADLNRRSAAAAPKPVAPANVPQPVPAVAAPPAADGAGSSDRQALAAAVPATPAPDAPIGEAQAPMIAAATPAATIVAAVPTQVGPVGPVLSQSATPAASGTVQMATAAPAPSTPLPAPVVKAAVPVAPKPTAVVAAGPVLTAAEKTALGIKARGAVTVASLTKAQKAKLAAADTPGAAVLTADEKKALGIKTRGDVTVASLTKAQKAKLSAAVKPEGDAVMLTAADKKTLGIKTRGDVTIASLTKAQRAKLTAAAPADEAEMLTAAQKALLGIKTKGEVTLASLTRVQKAKLAAADKPDAVVLTADEKKLLGIKAKGDVTLASLTKVQKAKLASGKSGNDAAVLTADEKKTLGIKARGAVTLASLTKAQRAKLAAGSDPKTADAKSGTKAKTPERHWVQVAGGANKAGLPKAYAGVKAQYPALLNGRSAWTTPLRFTNRLLVGPFGSDAEAQAFVNKATPAGLNAFTYTSPAGVEVEKVPAK